MIHVYCVLVKPLYNIKYVERLYNGVKDNLGVPFKLFCLTDSKWKTSLPIEFVDVTNYQLDTWWNKLVMFDSSVSGPDVNLYLDLDVKIVGNLDFLTHIQYDGLYVVDSVWKGGDYLNARNYKKFGNAFYCYGNSSVLGWRGKSQQYLLDKVIEDPFITMKHFGDDTYLNSCANIKYFEQLICDYYSDDVMFQMRDKRVLIHFKDPPI
jgi:hypothetical protein